VTPCKTRILAIENVKQNTYYQEVNVH